MNDTPTDTRREPAIRVRGLVNRFGRQVVHDELRLDVERDEILGVVGGSGSGKSVLMRSILGLHRPNAGEITVLGQRIRYQEPGPHTQWGVLFQNGALLSNLTVQQNVELPIALHSDMPVETRHELASLKLLMVGLSLSVADKYPSELSGGMKKRVSLARALAMDPKILFLDEPTAGLDPIAATEFDELITYLHDNLDLTIMMITHDVDSLFNTCNRIAVLVDGKVLVGTADEIVASRHRWVRSYFGVPRARRAWAAMDKGDRHDG
ncbi:ATP-binding cassette domain-containing protein [Marinihelvus fidelis]|uniref:ATP-binding cassette domain-containing protein n=1 Tax=Marinihelvus fidelis TaxID=2613842 RepID=A0A5N0TEB3_9GAMM|nr:ATP-binding cassette domain-containing protein [Marinihelvus fidelis]KAA9133375.1 ATP-binding cassette domain-containing protein [Marinihelvus fidelis]